MNNYKEVVAITVITFLIFFGLVWIASPKSSNQSSLAAVAEFSQNPLVSENLKFDFGMISMANGKVKNVFILKNTSNDSITISKVFSSCMCTNAILSVGGVRRGPFGMPGHGFVPGVNENVGPGGEAQVEIVFDPAAHGPAGVGPIERTVYVETSKGVIELEIAALVKP